MKRCDLEKATKLEKQLLDAERDLADIRVIKDLSIDFGTGEISLENYDEPSLMGITFRAVRAAVVQMFEGQISEAKRDLEKLGVTL